MILVSTVIAESSVLTVITVLSVITEITEKGDKKWHT